MSRQLAAAIALGSAIALETAIACAVGADIRAAPGDYAVMKANCTSIAVAGRAQCLEDAKGKDNAKSKTKTKDFIWHCEDLTSREERECIIRELEGQHADTRRPGQAGMGEPMAPVPQQR